LEVEIVEKTFKYSKDYSCEELLKSCQAFFGDQFWVWYQTVAKVVGEEKANEILLELAKRFAELEVDYVKMLWGKEFKNLEELTHCFDVIHAMVGYDCSWTMEDKFKGFEKISNCPIHSATPEELKGKGICKIYCNRIGEEAYSMLNAEISREKYLCDGDLYCGCRIEWNGPKT
jgi:hypothetical protein